MSWIDPVPMLIISRQAFLSQTIGNSRVRQLGVQESDMVEMSNQSQNFLRWLKIQMIRDILEESYFLPQRKTSPRFNRYTSRYSKLIY